MKKNRLYSTAKTMVDVMSAAILVKNVSCVCVTRGIVQ